jgi:hypothetical protein
MHGQDGARFDVRSRQPSQGLWNQKPACCRWIHHAACDDGQHYGSLHHYRRTRRRNTESRSQVELFPDSERKANTIFSSGDRVISEWTLTATKNEPFVSGRLRKVPICVRGVSVVQMKNGKISQWSDYYDQLTSYRNSLAAWFTEWVEL